MASAAAAWTAARRHLPGCPCRTAVLPVSRGPCRAARAAECDFPPSHRAGPWHRRSVTAAAVSAPLYQRGGAHGQPAHPQSRTRMLGYPGQTNAGSPLTSRADPGGGDYLPTPSVLTAHTSTPAPGQRVVIHSLPRRQEVRPVVHLRYRSGSATARGGLEHPWTPGLGSPAGVADTLTFDT